MAAAPTRYAPEALSDGLVLTGTGERIVKIGFVVVNVYSAAFYVDSAAAAAALSQHAGRSHDELVGDDSFRREFVQAKVDKVLRITLCRGLAKTKMTEAFNKSLGMRVSEEHKDAARNFVDKLIPDAGLLDNNVILVRLSADGETVEGSYQDSAESAETLLIKVVSGGKGGIWESFQGIYFDERTELPDIRRGFLQNVPAILASGPKAEDVKVEEPLEAGTPAPGSVEASASDFGEKSRSKSWKSSAGRQNGKDTYVIGDVYRVVRNKIRRRDQGSGFASDIENLSTTASAEADAELSRAQVELVEAKKELADATKKLQEVTARLARADQSLQLLARGVRSPMPRVILLSDALGLSLAFLALLRRRPGGRRLVGILLVLSLMASGYMFRREQWRARLLSNRDDRQAAPALSQ